MKNIWYQKKNNIFNPKIIISLIVLLIIIIWAIYGINIAKEANKEQQIEEMQSCLDKAVVLCYSIEGIYPPNIDYLKNNYGVKINEEKYIIHYDIFAENIKPEIKVFVNE